LEVGAKRLEIRVDFFGFTVETLVLTMEKLCGFFHVRNDGFFVVPSKAEDIFDGGKNLYVFFPWEELDPYPSSVSVF
jgi:hypothetical protein